MDSTTPPCSAGDASLGAIAAALQKCHKVLITSHIQPDGDSIGSSLALARALQKLGKLVTILHPDPCPEKYYYLDLQGMIEVVHENGLKAMAQPGSFDLGVLVDASDPARIGKLTKPFLSAPFGKICIDHHVSPRLAEYVLHFTEPEAAATASLILQLVDYLRVPLDADIAEPLFVGLSTDTGWFRYSNATPQVFREAARLIQAGIHSERIYNQIYEKFSLARIRLEGKVLDRLQSEFGGAYLWSSLDRQLIEASQVPLGEFDGLIDPLRTIQGGHIMVLFYEIQPHLWKVSFRSRGDIDVQKVATRLGGGGHAKAAGCNVKGDLATVSETLRREVALALQENPG